MRANDVTEAGGRGSGVGVGEDLQVPATGATSGSTAGSASSTSVSTFPTSSSTPTSHRSVLPRSERFALIVIAAVTLAMRIVAFFHYRFDSDEPQHLHVAWGWTAGLLPYRDVFDNHAPLFHMAAAPLLRLLGERAAILLWMRGPMALLWRIVGRAAYGVAPR